LIIITTDHGGVNSWWGWFWNLLGWKGGRGKHGWGSSDELNVFLIARGPRVERGSEIISRREDNMLYNVDAWAITQAALDLEVPEWPNSEFPAAKLPYIPLKQ
jgi:hypothetical protein